jgi:hypothetical protein
MVERDLDIDTHIEATITDNWTLADIDSKTAVRALVADVQDALKNSRADPECCHCLGEALYVALTALGAAAWYAPGNFLTDEETGELTPHGWTELDADELPHFPYSGEVVIDPTAGQFNHITGFGEVEILERDSPERGRYAY